MYLCGLKIFNRKTEQEQFFRTHKLIEAKI